MKLVGESIDCVHTVSAHVDLRRPTVARAIKALGRPHHREDRLEVRHAPIPDAALA